MTTVSDIKPPEYSDTDLDLLWIIANRAEGNTISESISDITPHPECWSRTTCLLYLVANEGADTSEIALANYPHSEDMSTETRLWHYIASELAGASLPFTLSDITPSDDWSTRLKLIYIIAQGVGVTSPLDLADISPSSCWSTETQLYYICATNGVELTPVSQGLELWHKFNATETYSTRIADYSDNTNTGTLKSGTALNFDGTDDKITLGTRITLQDCSWACTVQFKGVNNTGILLAYDAPASPNYMFWPATNLNKIYVKRVNNTDTVIDFTFDTSGTYHFCFTAEGSTLKMYVDGSLYGTYTLGTAGANVFDLNQIGSYNTAYYYNGRASGIKIFNTVLTAAQVLELYEQPEQILPTGSVAADLELYLPMVEGAGSTVYDGSNNNNNGTLVGSPTWLHERQHPFAQTALMDWNEGASGEILVKGVDGNDVTGTVIAEAKFTNSLNLNGRSYYQVTKASEINLNGGDNTIEFWVNIKKDQTNPIFDSGAPNNQLYLGYQATGKIFWEYITGAGTTNKLTTDLGSDIMQVVLQDYNGTAIKLYVNGVYVDQYVGGGISSLGASIYKIGSDGTNFMFGEIMAFRYYSEALTAAQITQNYNAECEDYGLTKI